MFFVYVLLSQRYRKTYVGCTNNIGRRIKEHNSGKTEYAGRFAPWMIVHTEIFDTLSSARRREKFLKSSIGRKELKKIFSNSTPDSNIKK